MIEELNKKQLAEAFEHTRNPKLAYEESLVDDDDDTHHHNYSPGRMKTDQHICHDVLRRKHTNAVPAVDLCRAALTM